MADTKRGKTVLKTYYETGDVPIQQQFADWLESIFNFVDDGEINIAAARFLKMYNRDYTYKGTADTSTSTPATTLHDCYIATEAGTILGVAGVSQFDILHGTGAAFEKITPDTDLVDLKFQGDVDADSHKITNLSDANDDGDALNQRIFNNRNFSLWNKGTVSFNSATGKLTVSSDCYVVLDSRLAVLQGGSGSGVITNFQIHPGTGSLHILYCDIPHTTSPGTINIVSETFAGLTPVAAGFQRLILGAAYYSGGAYYLTINGLYDKYVENSLTTDISAVASDLSDLEAMVRDTYSLWNQGVVTFNPSTLKLTVSSACWLVLDARIFVLQGGSGSGVITDFLIYSSGAANAIYVDIPETGSTGTTLTLQAAPYTTIPPVSAGYRRIILGTGYSDGTFTLPGLYEKDLARIITGLETDISTNSDDIDSLEDSLDSVYLGVCNGTNQDMSGANDWAHQIGTPTFDIDTTESGYMYIDFSSGNESVGLFGVLEIDETYECEITGKLHAGAGCPVKLGLFGGGSPNTHTITPTSVEQTWSFEIVAGTADFGLGVLSADNNGSEFIFTDIKMYRKSDQIADLDSRVDALEGGGDPKGRTFLTEQFLQSISKYDKALTKIAVVGDSLMANYIGGAIPGGDDEGLTMRPIRLDVNNIARRIYDHLSWNKATHRRLDHADWTKSGTWTSFNDTTVWEPIHTYTAYHKSIVSGAYIEIAVPSGQENFALICQKTENAGVLNITLNGGSIAAYGNSSIDLDRSPDSGNDIGNAYHTEEYLDLPSGINTIRISKEANVEEVRVWGGFYWSGNTMMVYNIAHGGHALTDLINDHLEAELVENDFDAIVFQLTIMNEMSHARTVAQSKIDLQTIIDSKVNGKDVAFMSCNPFGDNGSGTNYYALYTSPDMEDTDEGLREILWYNDTPFIDVFHFFKLKIENRGGTLAGGEGGLYYTDDGQHPNTVGVLEWWNLIMPIIFKNKPITDGD